MKRTRALAALAAAALLMTTAACSDDGGKEASEPQADVTVSAAPAVSSAVKTIVDDFEEAHPGTTVKVTEKDLDPMVKAVTDKDADVAILPTGWLTDPTIAPTPVPFATNNAVIVVPAGNPKHVAGLDAFKAGTPLRTQICGTPTPIGTFILLVMQRAGIKPDDDTVGEDCEADAVQKVVDGELDAAAMYRFGFPVPEGAEILDVDAKANFPIEVGTYVLSDAAKTKAFVDYLSSDEAKAKLAADGFVSG